MFELIAVLWVTMVTMAVIGPDPVDVDYPACKPPMLIDLSEVGWDDTLGRSTIDRAKHVCYYRYRGCLMKLTRTTEFSFRAICKRRAQ